MDRFRSQFTLKYIGLSSEHRVFFLHFLNCSFVADSDVSWVDFTVEGGGG